MLGLGSALHDPKSFAQASLEPGRHAELFSGLLGSYDVSGEALERHASHQVAGFLSGWAG
jgi:hypothetical protein